MPPAQHIYDINEDEPLDDDHMYVDFNRMHKIHERFGRSLFFHDRPMAKLQTLRLMTGLEMLRIMNNNAKSRFK